MPESSLAESPTTGMAPELFVVEVLLGRDVLVRVVWATGVVVMEGRGVWKG